MLVTTGSGVLVITCSGPTLYLACPYIKRDQPTITHLSASFARSGRFRGRRFLHNLAEYQLSLLAGVVLVSKSTQLSVALCISVSSHNFCITVYFVSWRIERRSVRDVANQTIFAEVPALVVELL